MFRSENITPILARQVIFIPEMANVKRYRAGKLPEYARPVGGAAAKAEADLASHLTAPKKVATGPDRRLERLAAVQPSAEPVETRVERHRRVVQFAFSSPSPSTQSRRCAL